MNGEEKRMLYSKRFPQINIEQLLKDAKVEPPDVVIEFASLFDLDHGIIFPEDRDKIEQCKKLVRRATELSELYDIDADIYEEGQHVRAILYLEYGAFIRELKERIAELFELCDDFAVYKSSESGRDISLSFTCRTYYQ